MQALRGVDLEVGTGELIGLLGPNGAGKSTLVKIVCGLVRATGGSATVCGHPAGSAAAQATLGYLAELFRFPDWCTAGELLALHQELSGSDGGAAERQELLELVELADVPDRRIGDMSKGMQQRLGIAQALIGSPRLLLLDEPTSALDPAGRRTVRALLEDLRERGVSVLLNSHLLSEVELVCDRVAIIDHGSVVAAGTPAELSRPGGVEIETAAGHAHVRAGDPRRRAADRPRAGRRRGGRVRRRGPQLDARGRLPRGGRPRVTAHVATPPGELRAALIIARFVLRESLRRRVFVVIGLLTLLFLGLYGLATWQAFEAADELSAGNRFGVDANTLVGATLAGLSLFAILFLGTILAVFLTLGAVRGDAERGLLQPLLVRPLRRRTLLLGRWLGRHRGLRALRDPRRARRVRAHRRARGLVAGPDDRAAAGARARRGDPRRAVARRQHRPPGDRERDRRVHAVRRRADRRPAGPDRGGRSARTGWSGSPTSGAGCSRSRRSTRPGSPT